MSDQYDRDAARIETDWRLACTDWGYDRSAEIESLRLRISTALRATAEAARRDERLAIWKSVMQREAMHPGEVANAMNALSAWICRRGEADTPSPTDLAALKEAVADAVMEQQDEDFCTASWWLTQTKIQKACAALAAAQQKESAK